MCSRSMSAREAIAYGLADEVIGKRLPLSAG
jgi:ATP-dependent protease ClpP protease subunit